MPEIKLYIDGRFETVRLESRRYCQDCKHWTMGHCGLFDLPLPPWAMPMRIAICYSAEAEAKARERVK